MSSSDWELEGNRTLLLSRAIWLIAKATEEFRRRLDMLLARPSAIVHGSEVLRGYRAIQILEYAGTPEARQLLQTLSQGAPAARLTMEAKASLERLK